MGRARMLLAGGAEELSEEAFLGFRKNDLLSSSGSALPFLPARDGTILGEGATLLVVESSASARERGVQPWAEIAGFGCAQDAHSISAFESHAEGATAAIEMALQSAAIRADHIACIVATASGSRAGDEMELSALKKVFGSRLGEIPVCAPKAALGESLGAAGAIGVLIAALALEKQCLPPTAGMNDAGVEGLRVTAHSQAIHGEYAMINAFSCDGNNASLVLRRVESEPRQ
jgi:3-oxoacyl-[acyl-carrier-protein] synthase II